MKPIPASSAGLAAGQIFDSRFRLEEVIGYGGMGQVWSATNVTTDQVVAIKVLHENVIEEEDARQRFVREARVMEALGDMSRHITRVLEHGVLSDGVPYLIMERLKGEGLDILLKRRKALPLAQVADIVGQLCKALALTHAENLIHRDIKPANIFLCPDSNDPDKIFVKLLDFGVVKVLSEVGESTLQGQLIGTPNYMSPEQLTPKAPVDHRADIFAVGAIAYRCLTGRVAFGKGTPQEMINRVINEMPPPPTSINPSLPAEVDTFMAKCLAKKPEDRFQGARELAETLLMITEDPAAARVSLMPRFNESTTSTGNVPVIVTAATAPVKPQGKGNLGLLLLLALLLLGGVVGALVLRGGARLFHKKKSGYGVAPGVTRYFSKSVTPCLRSRSSSTKKLPVHSRLGLVKMTWAASAMMSGVRLCSTISSPPSRFCTAAVAMTVRGHRVLTATPSGFSSSAMPRAQRLMPNLAMV